MNVATEAVQNTLANALHDNDPKAAGNEPAATASTASNPSTPTKIPGTPSEAASGSLSPQVSSTTAPADPNLDPGAASTKPKTRNKYPPTFKSAPTLSHKSKSTLVSLGVPEPYFTIKSTRRSRRPFTPVEDEALIKGYTVHGFQWTQIQQDKGLNLSHRKATDLRDRFRTKFPEIYKEGGIPPPPKPSPGTTGQKNKEAENASRNSRAKGGSSSTTASRSNSDTGAQRPHHQPNQPPSGAERRKSTTTSDYPISETTLPILRSIPPPPPEPPNTATSPLFQFPDEGGAGSGSNVDSLAWRDGSLPPLIWDEIA